MKSEDQAPMNQTPDRDHHAGRTELVALEEAGEGEQLFGRLVRRGRAFEAARLDEAETLVRQLEAQAERLSRPLAAAAAQTGHLAGQVEQLVAEGLAQTMRRLDVPSRSELDMLSDEVSRLTERVDRLRRLVEYDRL